MTGDPCGASASEEAAGVAGTPRPERTLRLWIWGGLLIFTASRMVILFGYAPYLSDVHLYFDRARQALAGQRAYTDFSYPYPPLSLALVYLPAWLGGHDFNTYRALFNLQLFSLDIALVCLLLWVARPLQLRDDQVFSSLCLLSVFGLLQGHLLYDRIDLGVSLAIFALLVLAISGSNWKTHALVSNVGALFKFLPALPAIFWAIVVARGHRPARTLWQVPLYVLPALATVGILEYTSHPGIYDYLVEHVERGIEIESLWATPYMIASAWGPRSSDVMIQTAFGAQELADGAVSPIYLAASKSLGAFVLALWAGWIFVWRPKPSTELLLLTPLGVMLIFVSTQRVLSPQFFIWLAPLLALVLPIFPGHRAWWTLSLSLFVLTYAEFDLGYRSLVRLDRFYVSALAVRNVALVLLTLGVMREWFKKARSA